MSAPGLKITNFHYSHMAFNNGPFVEYPKWIHMSGYPSIIAADAGAEALLLSRPPKSGDVKVELQSAAAEAIAQPIVEPPKHILAGVNDEREILFQIAAEKNIKVDKRWKLDRLRATIERETKDL